MTTPARPKNVPETARFVADNAEGYRWVDGAVDAEGKAHGLTRLFSEVGDGYLHQECTYAHEVVVGTNTVYHPDGTVASTGEWRDGTLLDAVYYRAKGESPEPFPGDVGASVVSVRFCSRSGTANEQILYFDAQGREVTDTGDPMPVRPPSVDADARFFPQRELWLSGGVLRGEEPKQVGICKQWTPEGVLVRHDEFDAAGVPLSSQRFFSDGALSENVRFENGERRLREKYRAPGQLSSREEKDERGRLTHDADFAKDGSLREEKTWAYEGDALARHRELGRKGVLLFEATRSEGGHLCRIHEPSGEGSQLLAEGNVANGRLAGSWRVLADDGRTRTEVDVSPYEVEVKDLERRDVFRALSVALYRHFGSRLGDVPELAKVSDTPWATLKGCYGTAKEFPSYLKALTAPEPIVKAFALGRIMSEIEHQGSVYPATGAVAPYFVRLLANAAVDRVALLECLHEVAQAAAPYRSDAEESLAKEPARMSDKEGDWRFAILDTLDAIGEGWPTLAKVLELGTPKEQGLIVSLAGHARGRDLAPEIVRLAKEAPSPTLRAVAVDALCSRESKVDAASLSPCLEDPDALVRMSAAIALACRFGPDAPRATDARLAEALAHLDERKASYYALPFVRSHPLAYLALAAGSRRTEPCFAMAMPLAQRLAEVDGVSAPEVGRGLLALAFGRCKKPFMPGFVDVLEGLAKSDPFFALNVNAAEVLRDFGLPGHAIGGREALTALVAELRAAEDPEGLLYARMHPDGEQEDEDD